MGSLLLVIDVQKDFINENTIKVLPKIEELIESNTYENVIFTQFINSENSPFAKKLGYKGCTTKEGQEIAINTDNRLVIKKPGYTAFNNELKEYISKYNIDKIYLCGFDTDACVLKTALDLFENNYDAYILKDYCMSSEGIETHEFSIKLLTRLIGRDKIII